MGNLLLAVVVVALAQTAPEPPKEDITDDIVVVGARDNFKMSMRAMRAAQSEFGRQRRQYAPDSILSFLIEPFGGAEGRLPVKLYLTDGRSKVAIDLRSDDSFGLPAEPAGKWWLEANRSAREIKISPLVMSPNATRYEYRLGDARLQCRILWAMEKASASVLAAPLLGMIDVAGPCTSQKIGIYVTAPRTVRSAILDEGSRRLPIPVLNFGRSYRLPVYDLTFSNEAHITLVTD